MSEVLVRFNHVIIYKMLSSLTEIHFLNFLFHVLIHITYFWFFIPNSVLKVNCFHLALFLNSSRCPIFLSNL